MFKPDVIITWPDTIDFPLFRKQIRENRDKFCHVIVSFSRTNWNSTSAISFIKNQMAEDNIIWIEPDMMISGDWRDIAVKKALAYVDSEWIWFTEQDFSIQEGFWQCVETLAKEAEVVGYFQDERLHPCCIFIKKQLLNLLPKDFSANPPKWDHFGALQKELDDIKKPIGIIAPMWGKHMNGLTHNIHLLMQGLDPVYEEDEFIKYCRKCLNSGITMQVNQEKLFEEYLGEGAYIN